jgi:hypothetical protein
MWHAYCIPKGCWFDDLPVNTPFHLAAGIYLEPVPDWVKDQQASENLSWGDRENIKDAQFAFMTSYEADALGSPDPEWAGTKPRAIQDTINERFSLAAFALWLAKPSTLSAGTTLHFDRENDPTSVRQAATLYNILVMESEESNEMDAADLRLGSEFLERLLTLHRPSSLWTAIQMLLLGLRESRWELRYLTQWIAIEALFGAKETNETTFRLSQRLALFLGEDISARREIFGFAKKAYGQRSNVVHGVRLEKLSKEKSLEFSAWTERHIRASFHKILLDPDLIATFGNGRSRDDYLDHLSFGQGHLRS